MKSLESEYPHLTEFMDKALFQEAAPSMEDAISLYAASGADVAERVIQDIRELMSRNLDENILLGYIGRHSDYMDLKGARETLNVFSKVFMAACARRQE